MLLFVIIIFLYSTYTIDILLNLETGKEKIYNEFPESLFKFSNLKYL